MGTPSDLTISFATSDDIAWLGEWDIFSKEDVIRQKIAHNEYIMARIGERTVGFICVNHLWSLIPFMEVIAVEDELQRQGIGRALVSFLEEHARAAGAPLIMSSSDSPGAQAWHRSVGFQKVGAMVLAPLDSYEEVTEVLYAKRLRGT
jgi:predicted N-acetyltransferase YhbS